jgi:hypothetical protein
MILKLTDHRKDQIIYFPNTTEIKSKADRHSNIARQGREPLDNDQL